MTLARRPPKQLRPARVPPAALACEKCGEPVDALDKFCHGCGLRRAPAEAAQGDRSASATGAGRPPAVAATARNAQFLRCEGCGAAVSIDADQRSYTCPFCDSNYVVEFAVDAASRQPPEFVIGFALPPEKARERFRQWLRTDNWLRPGDLAKAGAADKLRGVYLPFWSFSMLAETDWEATIGEHWHRTEMYTAIENGKQVTKARRVQVTEWWPLSGRRHEYHGGYLVSGSRGLPQADADRVMPYRLPAMARYAPDYLAGWVCEEYSIERKEALDLCMQEFLRREEAATMAFLPGDASSDVRVSTRFDHVSSDLVLLPAYLLGYRYRGKLYRFVMNGQTGACTGEKPISTAKVAALAVGVAICLLALWMLSNR